VHRIVYFVGAGLTKSLEIADWPVPMMWDFVSVMAHYLDDNVALATMVDLERADLYVSKSSEARELAETMFAKSANPEPAARAAFKQALERRNPESIEAVLERSLGASANFSAQGAHQRFRYAINRLFTLVGWNVRWAPLERFLQKQFHKHEAEHTFISFNYDLILDHAVQQLPVDWRPATGYGIEIPFYVTDDLPLTEGNGGHIESVSAAQFVGRRTSRVQILKPHGSLNWLVPYRTPYEQPREGLRFKDGPVIVPVTADGAVRYWPSTHSFQPVSLPGELPTEIGICLLAPSSAKRSELPFIKRSREMEMEALANADEIFVIGWSVPETDLDQADLISTAMRARAKQRRSMERVTVVNQGAAPDYFQRLAELFSVDAASLYCHNAGFVDFAAGI
jgi:hypothetical protein